MSCSTRCLVYIDADVLNRLNEGKGKQQFEISLRQVFGALNNLLADRGDTTFIGLQTAVLKNMPNTISEVIKVLDAAEFRYNWLQRRNYISCFPFYSSLWNRFLNLNKLHVLVIECISLIVVQPRPCGISEQRSSWQTHPSETGVHGEHYPQQPLQAAR